MSIKLATQNQQISHQGNVVFFVDEKFNSKNLKKNLLLHLNFPILTIY